MLGLLLSLSSPTLADEPDGAASSAVQPELEPAKVRLDRAIEAFSAGDATGARDMLLELVTDPDVQDEALLQEARIWLGDTQYTLGEFDAAERTFHAALLYDPELRLDIYVHPPEVVSFFDAVRASVVTETPALPPPLPPRPGPNALQVVVPGGLQFYNGQRALGVATTSAVAGLGVTAMGMRLWLVSHDEAPDLRGVQVYSLDADTDPRGPQLRAVRAIENSLGFAALGVWGLATVQGALAAGTGARGPTLTVGPGALGLGWRF